MIVVLGGIKGGTGKTTLAVNFAVMETLQKRNTILIDADKQDTATCFMEARSARHPGLGFASQRITGSDVRARVPAMKKVYSSIIIDSGGGHNDSMRASMTIADVLVVPFSPSVADVWTGENLSELIRNVKHFNPGLRCFAVLNRAETHGKDNEIAEEAIRKFKEFTFLNMSIGSRKAYKRAMALGQSVMEFPSATSQARGEISLLHQFIFKGYF